MVASNGDKTPVPNMGLVGQYPKSSDALLNEKVEVFESGFTDGRLAEHCEYDIIHETVEEKVFLKVVDMVLGDEGRKGGRRRGKGEILGEEVGRGFIYNTNVVN